MFIFQKLKRKTKKYRKEKTFYQLPKLQRIQFPFNLLICSVYWTYCFFFPDTSHVFFYSHISFWLNFKVNKVMSSSSSFQHDFQLLTFSKCLLQKETKKVGSEINRRIHKAEPGFPTYGHISVGRGKFCTAFQMCNFENSCHSNEFVLCNALCPSKKRRKICCCSLHIQALI